MKKVVNTKKIWEDKKDSIRHPSNPSMIDSGVTEMTWHTTQLIAAHMVHDYKLRRPTSEM